MKLYRMLSHVGDRKLEVEADSLKNLFIACLEGMNEIIKPDFCQKIHQPTIKRSLSVASSDATTLLIDFLAEVLTLSQINQTIFCQVKFLQFSNQSLKAILTGTKTKQYDQDIKAVTYHQAEINKNSQGNFQIEIVFDV